MVLLFDKNVARLKESDPIFLIRFKLFEIWYQKKAHIFLMTSGKIVL